MVYFLGDASKAYNNHFSNELRGMSESPLGPTVIIFHETRYTKTLSEPNGKSPEMILEDHFNSLEQVGVFQDNMPFGYKIYNISIWGPENILSLKGRCVFSELGQDFLYNIKVLECHLILHVFFNRT